MKDLKLMKYTGIGSRDAPETFRPLVFALGYYLASQGVGFLSGHAAGIDNWFEIATIAYSRDTGRPLRMRISLPKEGFNGSWGLDKRTHIAIDPFHRAMASTILKDSGVCTYLDRLPEYSQLFFCRNVYQIIDFTMDFTGMVIFYAKENREKGTVSGGTRIAVYLARHLGIPCYNLIFKEDREALFKVIGFVPDPETIEKIE